MHVKKHQESFAGMLYHKYRLIVLRCKRDGKTLGMTKEEFVNWSLANVDYVILHTQWEHSAPIDKTWLKPSVDRLDNARGYCLDNIRWVTWRENYDKEMTRQRNQAAFVQAENEEIPDYL